MNSDIFIHLPVSLLRSLNIYTYYEYIQYRYLDTDHVFITRILSKLGMDRQVFAYDAE